MGKKKTYRFCLKKKTLTTVSFSLFFLPSTTFLRTRQPPLTTLSQPSPLPHLNTSEQVRALVSRMISGRKECGISTDWKQMWPNCNAHLPKILHSSFFFPSWPHGLSPSEIRALEPEKSFPLVRWCSSFLFQLGKVCLFVCCMIFSRKLIQMDHHFC